MFEIRDTRFPKEFYNCESCGSHADDMKSIFIFRVVNVNGKMVRVGGNIGEACGKRAFVMGSWISRKTGQTDPNSGMRYT